MFDNTGAPTPETLTSEWEFKHRVALKNVQGPQRFEECKSLDDFALWFRTDKSSRCHDVCVKYERFLVPYRSMSFNLYEIGIRFFDSLNMWASYFPNANIIGMDIDSAQYVGNIRRKNISYYFHDAYDRAFMLELFKKYPPFLIIDDASHFWSHQIVGFEYYFPHLLSSGFYIVEDIETSFGSFRNGIWADQALDAASFFMELALETMDSEKGAIHPNHCETAASSIDIKTVESVSFIHNSVIVRKAPAPDSAEERDSGAAVDQGRGLIWRPLTSPKGLGIGPEAARFNIHPATGQRKLILLMPDADTGTLSEAKYASLQLAAEATRNGANVLIFALEKEPRSIEDFIEGLIRNLNIEENVARDIKVADARRGFSLNLGDKVMTTSPKYFPLARQLAKRCGRAKPALLVQGLPKEGQQSEREQAEQILSLTDSYLPIICSTPTAAYLQNIRRNVVGDEQGQSWLVFEPGMDRKLFYAEKRPEGRKRLLLNVGELDLAHDTRAELAYEAIHRMLAEGVLNPAEWEIRCYGTPFARPVIFDNGFQTVVLPELAWPLHAPEVRSSALAISLVFNPHPGQATLELAASGVPVITNTWLTKTDLELRKYSSYIFPVIPTFDGISSQLRRMLTAGIYKGSPTWHPDGFECTLPDSWRASFEPIMPGFMQWYNS